MINELREIDRRLSAAAAQIEGLQALVSELLLEQRLSSQSQASAELPRHRTRATQAAYGSRYAAVQRTPQTAGPADDTMQCTGRNHAFAEFRRPL